MTIIPEENMIYRVASKYPNARTWVINRVRPNKLREKLNNGVVWIADGGDYENHLKKVVKDVFTMGGMVPEVEVAKQYWQDEWAVIVHGQVSARDTRQTQSEFFVRLVKD